MTMLYVEITQMDLQREFQLARSHPRHLVRPCQLKLASFSWHGLTPGIWCLPRVRRSQLQHRMPTGPAFSFPCAPLSTSWRCAVVAPAMIPHAASLPVLKTGS
jgi:hypothetical protein